MEKKDFDKIIAQVKKHNDYGKDWDTVKECEKHGKWTPVDLICREYLNNGGGSARGFLGITPKKCEDAYHYIVDHNQEIYEQGLLHQEGWNNSGFPLWEGGVLD